MILNWIAKRGEHGYRRFDGEPRCGAPLFVGGSQWRCREVAFGPAPVTVFDDEAGIGGQAVVSYDLWGGAGGALQPL